MSYSIRQVTHNSIEMQAVEALLQGEGIKKDENLDYTCAMFDEDGQIIATGSCFRNTLRCFAVDASHQGEGLTNQIISHLIGVQTERGNIHLFLYTKCESAKFFRDLGFTEIARVDGQVVFMENRKTGFSRYLNKLERETRAYLESAGESKADSEFEKETSGAATDNNIAAIVMNANPFSKGHQYLVEKACRENALVHLFVVSEDVSYVPFKKRLALVKEGTKHLTNIVYHTTGPYMVSTATFPSYFLKEEEKISRAHAGLDVTIFAEIAKTLQITRRYVGEEPLSQVTNLYNQIMMARLPEAGVECVVVPRLESDGDVISASRIRKAMEERNWEEVSKLIPYELSLLQNR